MKTFAVLILLALMSVAGLAQVESLPPIGKDAIQNQGKIVTAYDEFTDKSKIETTISVADNGQGESLYLLAVSTFTGRKPKESPSAFLLLMSVSNKKASHETDNVLLLIDGERLEIKPIYTHTPPKSGSLFVEALVFPSYYSAKEIRLLSAAKQFKGRVGSYLQFEIGARVRGLLADFADHMENSALLPISTTCYENGRKVACAN